MDEAVASRNQAARRAALIVATSSSFLGPFMGSSVNVALPSIGRDFGMSAVLLSWVNTAFLLAAATLTIPFGRLGDIYGRKKIYWCGITLYTASSVLIALSGSATTLIASRVSQGFGASMIFATGMAILMSVYRARERGRVLGINVAAVYLGLSSGPFIGGLITEHLGWRFIFWLNVPLGLILLAVVFLMLEGDWVEGKNASFDLLGALILGASLVATLYGFSKLPTAPGFGTLCAGLTGITVFVLHELRTDPPLIDVRLFRYNTVFAFSNLAALINYAATFAVTFLLSLYLQQVRGFSPQQAGSLLVVQPLVQAFVSPLAGRLSDRIEPRNVASVGMGMTLAGLLLLRLLHAATSMYYVAGCLVFLGLGFALFSSPNTNAIMSSVDRGIYGVASAMVGTMRQLGMMFSMGIVMMVLGLHLGEADIGMADGHAFVTAMRGAFTVFAVLCIGGIFASLARGKIRDAAE